MTSVKPLPRPHVCVPCSRCGMWGTHTYPCRMKKSPPERGHKASTWATDAPCQEPESLPGMDV